ncbi:hypothetical protein Nocox_39740 [Nonomuraea coxensis DSM 45129]|uniref:Uncharacterized protein n=1 Tax=Nonomuraea coxensis DSM 45129 TaxID=1122611 RepID=A0ABX8UDF6_9ACTN|nr:hypothetical protein [Nonomuraea coxensis]QYC45491.1 hypothetical protein Nocox_39740 [Nonomuraea coxensis DSM 45129]
MSEYQYYEFLAIDRPLSNQQQAEVRALSTRAHVTATSFTNEYHWGDFRGDPARLMERYYDAHLYLANWGTHRIMLRLPKAVLDPKQAGRYCVGEQVNAWTSGGHLVLDFTSEAEEEYWEDDVERSLSAIVGIRAELAAGDLRPLYLAWLSAYGTWERDEDAFDYEEEDALEPPVPPGLGSLSAPQRALADFLRLDDDLLAAAAEASPPAQHVQHDRKALATWIGALSAKRKDALLLRVIEEDAASVRWELLREFGGETTSQKTETGRTVAELLDTAAARRHAREQQEAAQRAEEQARREQERRHARELRLNRLAQDLDAAWDVVETSIGTKKPREYDLAVELLGDLHALALRDEHAGAFTQRLTHLRERHQGKPSLIKRLNDAGLTAE